MQNYVAGFTINVKCKRVTKIVSNFVTKYL